MNLKKVIFDSSFSCLKAFKLLKSIQLFMIEVTLSLSLSIIIVICHFIRSNYNRFLTNRIEAMLSIKDVISRNYDYVILMDLETQKMRSKSLFFGD